MQHSLGRAEYLLAFRREGFKSTTPFYNGRSKLLLQSPNGIGQGGLGNVAGLRCATKMLVLMEGNQVVQRSKKTHGRGVKPLPLLRGPVRDFRSKICF